jgi:hypothetical protein
MAADNDDAGAREVVDGKPEAWRRFFASHAPTVQRLVRASRSMGSLARSEDHCRTVMARVFERLRRDDHRALRLFVAWSERHPAKGFDDWLTVVVTNVIRDFVSERLAVASADGGSVKALIELADELPEDSAALQVLPHATTRETARQLIELARATLSDEHLACLIAWLEGWDFQEIADRHALADGRSAERQVRAALARLRRRAR